jgi:hypothetical protein
MSFVVTKLSKKVFLKEETTANQFENPSSSNAIEVLADFNGLERARENIEDMFETGSRISKTNELSTKSVNASFPVRLSAGANLGDAPVYELLLKGFGYKNRGLTADVTTAEDHTTSIIKIEDADISKFKKNDIVFFKSGSVADKIVHQSPIKAVVTTSGNASIELVVPFAVAPDDNIVISKSKVYALDVDTAQDTTFTAVQQVQGDVEYRAWGGKTASFSLEAFEAGQKPSLNFACQFINYADILGSTRSAVYNTINNAWVRSSCVYVNADKVKVTSLAHSQEQTLTPVNTTCHNNNTESLLPTGEYTVTSSFSPRKEQGEVGLVLDNSEFSLFWHTGTPIDEDATESEKNIAFFVPRNKAVTSTLSDQEGYMVDAVEAMMQGDSMEDSPIIAFC